MRVVWKYQLMGEWGEQLLDLPDGHRIISCQDRDDLPTLWVECENDAPLLRRHFVIIRTGEIVPEYGKHIASLQIGNDLAHIYILPHVIYGA